VKIEAVVNWFGSAVIVLVSLAALYAALWLLFGWQVFGNNLTRYDLARSIRSMLILRENGGYLDIRHRGTQRQLRLYRESGGDDESRVVVWVPLVIAPHPAGAEILDLLRKHGYEPSIISTPQASITVPVNIADIWPAHSAAAAARVAHLVLDAWGIGSDERLDVRIRGISSTRGIRRLRSGKEFA
jgi:hypothetical protein